MAKIGEAVNMEDSTSNPDLLHIAIDPEGDVLLELADRQLQVSSKLMSIASTVFKALFGPAFAEGSLRSSEHVIRVLLPDDDEEAMTALCSILHYRFDLVPKKLHSDVLEELALLADKYDCVNALSMWSAQHLAGLLEQEEHVDYNTKLLPAYYFNDAKAFRQITKAMVYESEKPRINRPFVLPTFALGKRTRDTLPEGLLGKYSIAACGLNINTYHFQLRLPGKNGRSRLAYSRTSITCFNRFSTKIFPMTARSPPIVQSYSPFVIIKLSRPIRKSCIAALTCGQWRQLSKSNHSAMSYSI